MLKIAGQGTTDSIGSYKSSAHVNFYQLRWILVDVTDPV
ncbi:hypothetical protein MYOV003v1_p0054 [Vibrio phage 207E48.1]|nr:hypothetical protein MYOV003v1_p0054 [Vibrio phage 207E48.1]